MKDTYTYDEIRRAIEALSAVYDIVRVVDPSRTVAYSFPPDQTIPVAGEYACYAVWNKEQRCEHCVSISALVDRTRKTKYEFIDREIYNVLSKYIVIDGQEFVLEIVYHVKDEVLLGAFGHNAFIERILAHNSAIYTDALTGAYNRRFFMERSRMIDKFADTPECSFALIDLDHFKRINDTYGHAAGDAVLVALSNLFHNNVRPKNGDCVIRYGGDEFLILMSKIPHEIFIARMQQLLGQVQALTLAEYPALSFSLSIGGASQCEFPNATYEDLIKVADERLYRAKRAGGNALVIHT